MTCRYAPIIQPCANIACLHNGTYQVPVNSQTPDIYNQKVIKSAMSHASMTRLLGHFVIFAKFSSIYFQSITYQCNATRRCMTFLGHLHVSNKHNPLKKALPHVWYSLTNYKNLDILFQLPGVFIFTTLVRHF